MVKSLTWGSNHGLSDSEQSTLPLDQSANSYIECALRPVAELNWTEKCTGNQLTEKTAVLFTQANAGEPR